jgi:hypothetical protein
MKTAIAIDSLLFRDDSIFILELILNLFPNSEIYTIAHEQGAILGPIETRPIVSSFITQKTRHKNALQKNFWIMPSAVGGIPIHKTIEKMIVISLGYIHGLKLPDHLEKYLYVLDWDLINQTHIGWQRFFVPYVNDWREKNLSRYHKISVSSAHLKNRLFLPNAEVIYPTYRTEDYTFVRDEDHNFIFTHHLVYTHGLKDGELRQILSLLTEKGETVRVLGPDSHLEKVKNDFSKVEFGGDHCEATNALYSHQAKVIWDLSASFFPSRAFGALATGRPIIVRESIINRELLNQGAYFLSEMSRDSMMAVYQDVEGSYLSLDRKSLRRLGLRWNERLFKSRMAKFLDKNN